MKKTGVNPIHFLLQTFDANLTRFLYTSKYFLYKITLKRTLEGSEKSLFKVIIHFFEFYRIGPFGPSFKEKSKTIQILT